MDMDSLQILTSDQLYEILEDGVRVDTNYAISQLKTNYPSTLIIGLEYHTEKLNMATNLRFGFTNVMGVSTLPRFSMGGEITPIYGLSILGGISLGGNEIFQWGTGIGIQIAFVDMTFAYSEYGGILNNAKGFSLSAATSFVF